MTLECKDDLEDEFEDRLQASIRESMALGYNPSRFSQMLASSDGVSLARRLVVSAEFQDGIKRIVALGHPELAIESIMLEPVFAPLFTPEVLEAARWRLAKLTEGNDRT